jgi:hypothetical protein
MAKRLCGRVPSPSNDQSPNRHVLTKAYSNWQPGVMLGPVIVVPQAHLVSLAPRILSPMPRH